MEFNNITSLTINSPSGTLSEENEKVRFIKNNIDSSRYDITIENGLMTVKSKLFDENKKFLSVSSHIDTVYEKSFARIENDKIVGTLDNSISNLVLLELLKTNLNPQVVCFFTDNEETDESTIISSPLLNKKKFLFNVCLDVTIFCHYTHAATVENDFYKIGKKIKDKSVAYIPTYQCMSDETITLKKAGKRGFSFCLPVEFSENRCHSEEGGVVPTEKVELFFNLLLSYLNKTLK